MCVSPHKRQRRQSRRIYRSLLRKEVLDETQPEGEEKAFSGDDIAQEVMASQPQLAVLALVSDVDPEILSASGMYVEEDGLPRFSHIVPRRELRRSIVYAA
jgi:hypothetical protein